VNKIVHSLFALVTLSLCSAPLFAEDTLSFTQEQADAGRSFYRDTCQICHGSSLANGQFGTPLKGSLFHEKWKGKSVGELEQFMFEKMPPDKVMSLTPEQIANALAYILFRNDLMPGSAPLSGDYKTQLELLLPF
jgi:polar amino acid transport system substrate-binding protein